MLYDVYYTTGGGPWVGAGSDIWVNTWLKEIAPKLEFPSKLLIHRARPKNMKTDYESPIEIRWQEDGPFRFDRICRHARRIHILHGHYTPVSAIVNHKHLVYSNVLHNSVDHILKSGIGTDVPFVYHPYMSSEWERDVMEWSKYNIWVGLYDINRDVVSIPNFYEFKRNWELSKETKLGFTSRSEGRKNPH